MLYETYIYDGTFEGLFTGIFYCYQKNDNVRLITKEAFIPDLITTSKELPTEFDKFTRVYSSICNKLSYSTLRKIYYLYLSNFDKSEDLTLKYLRLCYTNGDDINLAKNNYTISQVDKYTKRVSLEAHRFTGFVRFQKLNDELYYSPIEPDNNILPIIAKHFTNRFSDQNFIIHDLNRNLALFYNTKNFTIANFSITNFDNIITSKTDNFKELWITFYNSINISERENFKLQKRQMPTRYWKHLTEIE